jgi:hypothetical protein
MNKSFGFRDITSIQAGFRNPHADVKAAGPLIDISRTYIRIIVKMQTGISPNFSPVLRRFPSRQPFTIPKIIADD